MKKLKITFSDGRTYEIPADLIARHRANYYKEVDANPTDWERDFDYAMRNPEELLDWAANNMNWSMIKNYAKEILVEPPKPNYDSEWTNAPKEVYDDPTER
jgi:hypothetical protein